MFSPSGPLFEASRASLAGSGLDRPVLLSRSSSRSVRIRSSSPATSVRSVAAHGHVKLSFAPLVPDFMAQVCAEHVPEVFDVHHRFHASMPSRQPATVPSMSTIRIRPMADPFASACGRSPCTPASRASRPAPLMRAPPMIPRGRMGRSRTPSPLVVHERGLVPARVRRPARGGQHLRERHGRRQRLREHVGAARAIPHATDLVSHDRPPFPIGLRCDGGGYASPGTGMRAVCIRGCIPSGPLFSALFRRLSAPVCIGMHGMRAL